MDTCSSASQNGEVKGVFIASPAKISKLQESMSATHSPKPEFDDMDIDDDLDPAMKEELDRLDFYTGSYSFKYKFIM